MSSKILEYLGKGKPKQAFVFRPLHRNQLTICVDLNFLARTHTNLEDRSGVINFDMLIGVLSDIQLLSDTNVVVFGNDFEHSNSYFRDLERTNLTSHAELQLLEKSTELEQYFLGYSDDRANSNDKIIIIGDEVTYAAHSEIFRLLGITPLRIQLA